MRKPDRTPVRVVNRAPSFTEAKPLTLAELPAPPALQARMVNAVNSYLRVYTLGDCTVIVTKKFGRWYLSIACRHRPPTWDEIAEARYRLIPDDVMVAQILPPRSQYINVNPNCHQLTEVRDPDLSHA